MEDRKKYGKKFDAGMTQHCKTLIGLTNESKSKKRRSKEDQNSDHPKREKCLTPRVIRYQQAQREEETNNKKEGTTFEQEFIDNMFV